MTRFDFDSGKAIGWTTLLVAALAAVETRVRWEHLNAKDDAGLIVLWLVVAGFGAAVLTTAVARLRRRRRVADAVYWEADDGRTIDARRAPRPKSGSLPD